MNRVYNGYSVPCINCLRLDHSALNCPRKGKRLVQPTAVSPVEHVSVEWFKDENGRPWPTERLALQSNAWHILNLLVSRLNTNPREEWNSSDILKAISRLQALLPPKPPSLCDWRNPPSAYQDEFSGDQS
jgi:hypothetical protein